MVSMWTIVIIGFGTVALALVAIMLMLELFNIIFAARKSTVVAASAPVGPTTTASGGNELIAAISAAINAYQSADGCKNGSFRIVEIVKAGVNTPAWSSQDRMRKHPRGANNN